ncbi:MAG: orotidine-5'-phosphate decarboxylase [Anaerolineae bacterium]|nr:orotidine-5'-phosphate decarboxylase [Anaerolineae bacterium]
MSIYEKYERRVTEVNSLVCVGLDSQIERLPARFLTREHPQFEFNQWIIQQTHTFVSAYKPNMAFYEARGAVGWQELALTMQYLREQHPEILTICDAKRADIGSTNEGYVTAIFDDLGFDAVTLHPYLGQEALNPFLEREDKACIILCRTSNPGAGELQDLRVEGKPLWQTVAEKVSQDWNTNNNCMLVVGATYPDEMRQIRQIVGEMTFLVPGIGAQGGEVEKTVRAGLNRARRGMIVNSSRGLIFADNPGEAANRLRDDINRHRG